MTPDIWQILMWDAGKLLVAMAGGWALSVIALALLGRVAAVAEAILVAVRRPVHLLLPALAVQLALPVLVWPTPESIALARHLIGVVMICAVSWVLVAVVQAGAQAVKERHDVGVADNLEARRVHTQVTVLARTIMTLIVILGSAAVLMTFPRVRELGASMLVSAGFAGLAIGLAARPVLENLIAGLQLAFTQPIRIDDVVIIDGEWGRIEEITTTYVVVRIWDERRLIVPFSKFISNSFQNWTRRSADILGTVYIYGDYRIPVGAVRKELGSICENSDNWDRRVCVLQVTNATDRAIELRALVSAANSSAAWDLRVQVREKLIEFLQREHPECLPRTRVEIADRQGRPSEDGGSPATPG